MVNWRTPAGTRTIAFSSHQQAASAIAGGGQAVAVVCPLHFSPLMLLGNGLIVLVTGDQRPIRHCQQCGFLCATAREGVRASRMEVAARGPVDRARDVTLEDHPRTRCARLRDWHRG
jgi:hypothetical protein